MKTVDIEELLPVHFRINPTDDTEGMKIASLLEATLNTVHIKDKDITFVQTNGIVQGGSDCVSKFSSTLELIIESSIEQSGGKGVVFH